MQEVLNRISRLLCAVLLCLSFSDRLVAGDEVYKLSPDSQVQADVPQGKITQAVWQSKIFPDTQRYYSVYVPAQYDGTQPAAVLVFQDGHAYADPKGQFRAPTVMDNLIHRGEMPITIGIFIDPGHRGELPEERGWRPTPRNRSFEYDTLSDQYARFLLEEMLPEVAGKYKLTTNPDARAICGISSGGICAFTVAWERPDEFRKVITHVGSFVNIRGGHNYEALIRKTPNKPLRVFMQDGSGDLDNEHGNWPLANQEVAAALKFKTYDYRFEYGEGAHSGAHGGAILPDALRWIWRDWQELKL